MRVYLPVDAEMLAALAAGQTISVEGYLAASQDEEDELAALETAADEAPAVAVAETNDPDGPIGLDVVESIHLDADNSGDLAWFDTTEITAVIGLLKAACDPN